VIFWLPKTWYFNSGCNEWNLNLWFVPIQYLYHLQECLPTFKISGISFNISATCSKHKIIVDHFSHFKIWNSSKASHAYINMNFKLGTSKWPVKTDLSNRGTRLRIEEQQQRRSSLLQVLQNSDAINQGREDQLSRSLRMFIHLTEKTRLGPITPQAIGMKSED
jgi:hypothetical protein